jgi:phosphoribosyl 1,2-cyclic phosphodiesterase
MNEKRKIFLAHISRNNNTPDTARETVSEITGIKRSKIDCLEFKGDTRILKV